MFSAIPGELKAAKQWIVWRNVWLADKRKFSKQPLSPYTGQLASVIDPNNYATFDHACAVLAQHGRPGVVDGIGFVFATNSGFVGIDLDQVLSSDGKLVDERAKAIADRFNSYTEISPSGRGLHIIVKGSLNAGYRRDGVEIYGSGRFFTVTGQVFANPGVVYERQTFIDVLADEIKSETKADMVLDWTIPPVIDNATVWATAKGAANGEKFFDLWNGNWQKYYASQSEADYALIDIISFYSDSPAQIRDLFMMSGLGQRDKAQRAGYVGGMIQRSFDRKPPRVTLPLPPPVTAPSPVPVAPIPAAALDADEVSEKEALASNPFTAPHGLVGEIAQWVYRQSLWPMEELCIIAALGIVAGIAGRQYQFQRSGLNLYLMLLAGTGAGKEAMAQAVHKIFDSVIMPPRDVFVEPGKPAPLGCPAAEGFQGPTSLTGKGLLRFFNGNDPMSAVSVVPEFSQTMSQMADTRAHSGLREFQQVLLDFYMKSSDGSRYSGAMNADKTADIKALNAPAFTLLCEGTPERFWRSMSEAMVTDGLMSRFIVFERNGYVMERNTTSIAHGDVPENITQSVRALCELVLQNKGAHDRRINVAITPEADELSLSLSDAYRRKGIAGGEIHKVLWLRAHQNIMRIAAVVAVGCNIYAPTITVEHVDWADKIIRRQVILLAGKFRRGEIGSANEQEAEQFSALKLTLERYLLTEAHHHKTELLRKMRLEGMVPLSYLQQKLSGLACFKQARIGTADAITKTTRLYENLGMLERVVVAGETGTFFKIKL